MVDYFKNLRPASLRGVPFMVDGDDSAFGRRVITHEFPGRDKPGHEDLGASPDGFSITAIVAGNGYQSSADALESALKKSGAAILIHPHYGEINVIVQNAVRSHSSAAAGEIRFSISMERYSPVEFPTALTDTAGGLLSASTSSFAAILSDFNSFFQSGGIPDFVTLDAVDRNSTFLGGLNGLLNKAGIAVAIPTLNVLTGGFAQSVVDLYKDISSLAAPKKKPVVGTVSTTTTVKPSSLIHALTSATDQSIVATSAARTTSLSVRQNNAQALDFLHRMSALAAATGTVRYMNFESREEAMTIRDGLYERLWLLRDQLGERGWDQSWKAAAGLQAALQRDINERIGRLPKTVRIRPVAVRSSLALANRLYGDDKNTIITRADDMVRRNSVRHPGFMPAADMEVLIDAN